MALTEEQLEEIAISVSQRVSCQLNFEDAIEIIRGVIAGLPKPEPLFWYRPCCDGEVYEGPIHNAAIEDVRKNSGAWKPLYTEAPIAQHASAPSEQKPVDVAVRPLAEIIAQIETLREEALDRYDEAIQQLCNKYGVMLATGHLSDMWQVKKPRSKVWKDDMDRPVHPIFAELNTLDAIVADIGLGPTNMMLFKPNASVKGGA